MTVMCNSYNAYPVSICIKEGYCNFCCTCNKKDNNKLYNLLYLLIFILLFSVNLFAQDTLYWSVNPNLERNQDLRRFDIYHKNDSLSALPDTNQFVLIDTVDAKPVRTYYNWLFEGLPGDHVHHYFIIKSLDHILNASGYSDVIKYDVQYPQTPFGVGVSRKIVHAEPGDTITIILPNR